MSHAPRGFRGRLLPGRPKVGLGIVPAVLLTSAVFALMHVPLYRWGVLLVDFGAALALSGLRLISGGVAAPSIAHALADLATWWI